MTYMNITQKLFPKGVLGRGPGEVNGLSEGTVPAGKILGSFKQGHSQGDRREHYLVEIDGHVAAVRVCTAMPDSGYAEFAYVYYLEKIGSDTKRYQKRFAEKAQLEGK